MMTFNVCNMLIVFCWYIIRTVINEQMNAWWSVVDSTFWTVNTDVLLFYFWGFLSWRYCHKDGEINAHPFPSYLPLFLPDLSISYFLSKCSLICYAFKSVKIIDSSHWDIGTVIVAGAATFSASCVLRETSVLVKNMKSSPLRQDTEPGIELASS